MQSILSDFLLDLDDVVGVINLHSALDQNKSLVCDIESTNAFQNEFTKLLELYRKSSKGVKKVPGTIVPYVAGRFEVYVRTIFEETATRVAKLYPEFKRLPHAFQDSLIADTSKVIADPRKFQHGDGARNSFIKNLHNNIHNNDLSTINYQCMSTTDRNMKAAVITDLFSKINYKKIWDDIAAQANIRYYFDGEDISKTRAECEKKLDSFMETRNGIAHPSNDVTWLSDSELVDYINFLKELAKSIAGVCPLFVKQKEKALITND
jgi:hypothetical protein